MSIERGDALEEIRHYLQSLPEGTTLSEIEDYLGLYHPSKIDRINDGRTYVVIYKMRSCWLRVAAHAIQADSDGIERFYGDNLAYAGQVHFGTTYGDGVLPAVFHREEKKCSPTDPLLRDMHSYLFSLSPGTCLSKIEEDLGLPPRYLIEPPSRLVPVYTITYQTPLYRLVITADAPYRDRWAKSNIGNHPLANDLYYQGTATVVELVGAGSILTP
jgi:hypothetical protein